MNHTRTPLIVPFVTSTAGARDPQFPIDSGWRRGGLVPDTGWVRGGLVPDAGWVRGGLIPDAGWRIP